MMCMFGADACWRHYASAARMVLSHPALGASATLQQRNDFQQCLSIASGLRSRKCRERCRAVCSADRYKRLQLV
jgi:hypothetical protein